jgi:hypothetical protein
MDWRKLPSDTRLHALIFERVAEANPELTLDELYESTSWWVREFNIYVGSSSATAEYGVITPEVEVLFAHGACALLAHALHQHSGFPLIVWTSEDAAPDSWRGHAAVLLDEETILDVRGVHSFEEVVAYYRGFGSTLGAPQVLSSEAFWKLTSSDSQVRADPYSFVDELEHLLIEEYAEQLLKEYAPVGAKPMNAK